MNKVNLKKVILGKSSLPRLRGSPSQKGESKKVILAIETSCDETAAAVLEVTTGNTWPEINTLSSIVNSQIKLHSKMGGVVPEVAARAHVKNIRPVVEKALQLTTYNLQTVDYIAVTVGPGLIPSLIVGVEFAKALAMATNKPVIPINHMLGHLYSPFGKIGMSENRLPAGKAWNVGSLFPNISLIVSGGHTILVLMENAKKYRVLGQTVDDAAGEAFDKVAKLLGLPYPGGPEVSKLAQDGNPTAINFPRPMLNNKNYNFSFSGLKTAVLYYVRANIGVDFSRPQTKTGAQALPLQLQTNICASFQAAAVDVLVQKTIRAVKEFQAKSVSLSGGVSANKLLREKLKVESEKLKISFFVPEFKLCTDNAEMIGIAAAFSLHNGTKPVSYKKVKPDSNLTL